MAARANAASTLLERATALQVREFLRARENNLQIRCLCPRGKRHYLDKFNLYLWQARFDPKDHEIAKQLWKWYIRTQLVVPDFLRALSTKAWNILWRTQSLRTPAEPKTIVHLTRLVEDMRKAGYKASFEQRLVHIETMFGRGDRTEAILEWQEGYMTQKGRTQDSYRPEYLELGIHMYSAAGDSTRALELLLDLFAAYPEWNPKAILYVFDAHVRSGLPAHVKLSWALYLYFQGLLGDKITLDDYERCYAGFLKAGYREHALAVFSDMMSSPELRKSEGSNASAKILQGLNDLSSAVKSAEQLNEVFLGGLLSLPRKHQNDNFFDKWIKRLVGLDHLDAAAQVFELMFERGIQPRARSLNRLMAAWVRSGNPDNIQRAETLGLQMVVERIALVQRRNEGQDRTSDVLQERLKPRQKFFLRRTLPFANSDTFEILSRIYLTQGNKDKLLDLKTWQIKHAKLPTNTSAVNAEMAFYLQHGHLHDVWRTFERDIARKAKSQIATTRPDLGTFIRLWEASLIKPRHISQPAPSRFYSRHFPPPAIILRHTLSWLSSLSLKTTPAETLASLRRSRLPNLVAKTLTAWNDLPGALVAMHALYHASPTPLPPTQQTATVLARAIARLGFRARTPRQRRDVNASTALRLNQEKVLHALRFIVERRLKQQQQQQQNGEEEKSADDGEKEKAQLLLDALSELVRAALVRRGVDAPEKVEARIEGVKRAARVPAGMPTGDKSAVEVAMEIGRG
ncbi:Pentatricopeptide repeat protein [Neofusicoccum parvum]|uniref:Pentatricopeptide repeat protein n=1 Tax=Neofusicoccum parvum TaxID=310453 RepID=A0ACB5RP22_9PEZI|nr:Pentatricopeptide repeat protein [Neofusicoccum parvum]